MRNLLLGTSSFQPLYAPEMETGSEPAAEPKPRLNESLVDGPGSGRGTLRKQLEKSTEDARTAEAGREREARGRDTGKKVAGIAPDEAAEPGEPEAEATPTQEVADDKEPATEAAEPATAAPEAWTKEAKA